MVNLEIRWAIFVSGNGSNLQNLLDLEAARKFKRHQIVAVYADKDCPALARAQKFGKATLLRSPRDSDEILAFLAEHRIDQIFLLGFMRLLKVEFLKKWAKPILNLHPSALPKYPGLDSIARAVAAKEPYLGVSLHEVIEAVDAGPLLRQITFPIAAFKDDLEKITAEVHRLERQMVADYFFDLDCSNDHLASE